MALVLLQTLLQNGGSGEQELSAEDGKGSELKHKELYDVLYCMPVKFLSVMFIRNQITNGDLLPWLLRLHVSPVDCARWCVLNRQPGSDTLKCWVDICV